MSTIDEDTYAELWLAVDAGAEFMDAIDADWYWIVDPERLNMRNDMCVTAQHHPGGLATFGPYGITAEPDRYLENAFNVYAQVTSGGHVRVLTDLWREAIYDRRAAYFERTEQAG